MKTVRLIGAENLDEFAQFALNEATLIVQKYLSELAINESLLAVVNSSFGNLFDAEKLENLRRQWGDENFEAVATIELRPATEINGANGAFAAVTNTIYLSQEYIAQNSSNPQAITNVLLEEIGHFVDAQINASDSPGDEGAIFSALVRGETVDEWQLQQLRAEDDTATIMLDGQVIQIEQLDFNGIRDFEGDIGVYYDPSDQIIGAYDPAKERPDLKIAPDLSPSEVNIIERLTRLELELLFINPFASVSPTKSLWELYLQSSPTYRADRQFFYDGSEIAKGFIEAPETKEFINAALVILQDKIESSLEQNSKTSWNIDELLPHTYLNPNYNYDDKNDGRWADRDNYEIDKKKLPQNYKGLQYEASAFNIPGLIAGGVGYGGNTAIPETRDPTTGVIQPARPENLIPDTRKLEGTVDLIKINDFIYQLNPKLKITVEDTIDFSPGDLGSWLPRILTQLLWELETNGGAYDVPFTVEFTPDIESISTLFFNIDGFLQEIKELFRKLGSSVKEQISGAKGLGAYESVNSASDLVAQATSLTNTSDFSGFPFLVDTLITLLGDNFLDEVYTKIEEKFKVIFGEGEDVTFEEIQEAFYKILNSETGLGFLKDTNRDGGITEEDIIFTSEPDNSMFKLNFALGDSKTFRVPLPSELGLSVLRLKLSDNEALFNLDYNFNFGFGVNTVTNQFFFDTADEKDLSISLTPLLPDATATLGFLEVAAKDIGSKLDFSIDLDDGNGNQLTIDELNNNYFTVIPEGSADIELNLISSINGSKGLPQIGADLLVNWDFVKVRIQVKGFDKKKYSGKLAT